MKKKVRKSPRARSAYNFYVKEKRSEVKAKNPNLTFGEVSAKVGSMWKNLPAGKKKKFEKMAEEDKKRVQREKMKI